jgi:RimJ/RimL family protein N-acetyltransferase
MGNQDMISFVPMTEAEFAGFCERLNREYARDQIEAGKWSADEALAKAEADTARHLPEGLNTANQYLYMIRDDETGETVGKLWFSVDTSGAQSSAFILEFEIDEDKRGKGYGKRALEALDAKARELGIGKIGLHVFAHNHVAKGLYDKMGYKVTDYQMSKDVGGEG